MDKENFIDENTVNSLEILRLMEARLSSLVFEKCLINDDDGCIIGRNFSESLENLGLVLSRFRQTILKINPSKCKMFQTTVVYLVRRNYA